jgi:purine-nucleoside phosphorylase
LNIDFLIVTNAAGGLNPMFNISDLMLIKSHINFFQKALIGNQNIEFSYDTVKWAKECAISNKLKIFEGCYYASSGPVYETQAEINFIKKVGADAVGMSTIPDILKANELGIKTLGISCITNLLHYGMNAKVTHDEVVTAGAKAYKVFSNYLNVLINDY